MYKGQVGTCSNLLPFHHDQGTAASLWLVCHDTSCTRNQSFRSRDFARAELTRGKRRYTMPACLKKFKIISLRALYESGRQRVESVWKDTNLIRKHSTTLHGHRTSISLEDAFWDELRNIAEKRKMSFAALLAEIDDSRPDGSNLSSSLRVYVLNWLKSQS